MHAPLVQWTLYKNKYIKPGNDSYPVISTHYIIDNMEYGGNTHGLLTEGVSKLHSNRYKIRFSTPFLITSFYNHSNKHLPDIYKDRLKCTGFSSRVIWTPSGIIRRRGYIGFTTAHILKSHKTPTQMSGYTAHFQRQVRHTICWFYSWTNKSMK